MKVPDVAVIAEHFAAIMTELGLDLKDESLKETPMRVARMYKDELCRGLYEDAPDVKDFPNDGEYDQMIVQKDITLTSMCEHHWVSIVGKAHIAYLPNERVIGLSKIIRIVNYYSRRPQLQERLTEQIAAHLKKTLNTNDVAIVIEARHNCYAIRGVKDPNSFTTTSSLGGSFRDNQAVREEFFNIVNNGRSKP